jgi:hypothetical protein
VAGAGKLLCDLALKFADHRLVVPCQARWDGASPASSTARPMLCGIHTLGGEHSVVRGRLKLIGEIGDRQFCGHAALRGARRAYSRPALM